MKAHELAAKVVRKVGNYHVIEVDTTKAHYFGLNWRNLGGYGKRKFENLVFIGFSHLSPKIIYL